MKKQVEFSPREAAQRLEIGLDYLYCLLWSGKLRGRKIDKQWRIPAEAIEQRLKTARGE